MKLLAVFVILINLTGCAVASLVQSDYGADKGGIVKYNNPLIAPGASREKAERIMAEYCAPYSYSILQQTASIETLGYNINQSYNGASVTPNNRDVIYSKFKCSP